MRIVGYLLACLFIAVGLWVAAASGQDEAKAPDKPVSVKAPVGIKIVPVFIDERRPKLLTSKKVRWSGVPPELTLKLHVIGDVPAKAKRFGRVKIIKAIDNTGANLIKAGSYFSPIKTVKWMHRSFTNDLALELRLKAASRKAVKISTLKGSFVLLSGGEIVDVIIPNVVEHSGKEIKNAILAEVGVKLKIDSRTKDGNTIYYNVEGNTDVVMGSKLVDAKGKFVKSYSDWWKTGLKPKVYTHRPKEKMTERAGLKLIILKGAKVVTVPIKLKDIPLP